MFKVLLLIVVVLMENVFLFGSSKAAAANSRMPPPHGVVYQQCPSGWVTYEGSSSCYTVPPHPTNNWYAARKTCLSMGSDLVKISSIQENNYVAMLAHSYFLPTSTNRFIWIGFFADPQRRFNWVDGTPLTGQYLNWGSGEPNSPREECGSLQTERNGNNMKWNDLLCLWTHKIGYVCERERPKHMQIGC